MYARFGQHENLYAHPMVEPFGLFLLSPKCRVDIEVIPTGFLSCHWYVKQAADTVGRS
jgi:hypothetical protein